MFNKNPDAIFNFIDAALSKQPLPQLYQEYMKAFFEEALHTFMDKGSEYKEAFQQATDCLAKRFVDSFEHHIVRHNLEINGTPTEMNNHIKDVESYVSQNYMQCGATHKFEQLTEEVQCENIGSAHGKVHQSSKTYDKVVSMNGILGKLGYNKTVAQACRWNGDFEPSLDYTDGWLSRAIAEYSQQERITFFQRHKEILAAQREILLEFKLHNLCLACILNIPSERLQCSHLLCLTCCKELVDGGMLTCPFCNQTAPWKEYAIPKEAGIRILTLDGGGLHGIISSMILQYIEEHIQIPCRELFDFMIGSSTPGLTVLGCGVAQLSSNQVTQKLQQIFANTYQYRTLFQRMWNKSPSELLHNELEKFLDGRPMLGSTQSPQVAIVLGDKSLGTPCPILFTSYNSSSPTPFVRKTDVSLLQTGQATAGAGMIFPVCESRYFKYINKKIIKLKIRIFQFLQAYSLMAVLYAITHVLLASKKLGQKRCLISRLQ